jgi:hypothetical protein
LLYSNRIKEKLRAAHIYGSGAAVVEVAKYGSGGGCHVFFYSSSIGSALDISSDIGAGCATFVEGFDSASVFALNSKLVVWKPPAVGATAGTAITATNAYTGTSAGAAAIAGSATDFAVYSYDTQKFYASTFTSSTLAAEVAAAATLTAVVSPPVPIGGMLNGVQVFIVFTANSGAPSRAPGGAMLTCFTTYGGDSDTLGDLIAVNFNAGSSSPIASLTLIAARTGTYGGSSSLCLAVAPVAQGSQSIVLLSRVVASEVYSSSGQTSTPTVTYNKCSSGACSGWQSTPPFSGLLGDAAVL